MENKILYITSNWKLIRKDNTLLFENEKTKKYIPIINIEQIFCIGEISTNSKLFEYLSELWIIVHFFNYYWYYIWSYYPREKYVSWKLLVNQVEHYIDNNKRLILAKKFVEWILENSIHFLFNHLKAWKDVWRYIDSLKNINLNNCENINTLLKNEWNIWEIFYKWFWYLLKDPFKFEKRVKRPPSDPVNSLISFSNILLYSYIVWKIYFTYLNPTISYLHEPFERRFSLALDIAEVFKIPITFSLIINLLNKNSLKEYHFDENYNYCTLTNEWKKIFLKFFNEKIEEKILHPILKRKVSFGTIIKIELYKLIKHLIWEKEYTPFSMKNKY